MSVVINRAEGDIPSVSNEIELCLDGVSAQAIIQYASNLELDPEVNQEDVVELLVSMANDADELNQQLTQSATELQQVVTAHDGQLYGGSSLLANVDHREPAWYRTTSLSQTLARNLLDITSQQIVIGVDNEQFGVRLYNMLRQLTPILLALSASSPYRDAQGRLQSTQLQSRRIHQYLDGTSAFPSEIIETPPILSLGHYQELLQSVSDMVNDYLSHGQIDSNYQELYKHRADGSYAPFNVLAPHQVYWMVRPRPDHANSDSAFSLEVRVSDTPVTVQRMQMINSFVLGLSYYAADGGMEDIDAVLSHLRLEDRPLMPMLAHVAEHGMQSTFGRQRISLRKIVRTLSEFAERGLLQRGLSTQSMCEEIQHVLQYGNQAEEIQRLVRQRRLTQSHELIDVLHHEFVRSIH